MASSAHPAVVDVLDELDLYRVILESLDDETRPDTAEQRRETLETIHELETKLAELRGERRNRTPSPAHNPLQYIANTAPARTQPSPAAFPSPSISSSPPQFGRPAFSSLPRQPHTSRLNHILDMAPARKRRIFDDDDDQVLQESSKRPVVDWPAHPLHDSTATTSSSSRTPTDQGSPSATSDAGSDMDDLMDILGLDRESKRELREEQERAEKWLEARKEQERLDEEYARTLMESARAPSPPQPPSSPGPAHQRTFPIRPHQHVTPSTSLIPHAPPATRITANPPNPFRGPQFDLARSGVDSDDSDIAEITPRDFQHRIGGSPGYQNTANHLTPYPTLPRIPGMDHLAPLLSHGSGYPYYNPMSGPSNAPNPGSSIWAHPANAALATWNAAKDRIGSLATNLTPGPIRDVIDLVDEHLSPNLSRADIANIYEYGTDPKQLNDEIKQLLETIRPDDDISEEDREGTPEALKYTLMDHQKLGLAWMKSKEECDQKGGILADDMGLGKTMQAIALMVSRPSTETDRKTTLIIAPVALMQQWKREIQRMLRPKHQLSVYVLHNEKRNMTFRDLKQYDVVLTTFGTLSSELKRIDKYEDLLKSGAEEPTLTREYLKKLPCLGPTSKWYRVIIDEAQCIKNRNTKAATACCRLNATYRWCMSGTPMMNSVEELHSLLKFLRIRPYGNIDAFNKDFTRPLKSNNQATQDKAMTQLRVLLKAVLLRRTKESKINGKPILNLPRRVTEKEHATFSQDEMELYQSLENKTQLQFNRYLEAGTVGRNYSNILVLLLRLRQACCHPHLIQDFGVKLSEATEGLDFIANAKMFGEDVIVRLRDNENLECPICIDVVDNPVIFFPCGHSACAECFARISDPALLLQQGIDAIIKCPNCRGVVDPKKITDQTSFRKVHFPDTVHEEPGSKAQEATNNEDSDDDDSDDDDEGTLSEFIVNDEDDEFTPRKNKGKGKGKGIGKSAQRSKKTLAELKKEASRNQASKRKYLRRLERTWVTSAKIEKTMEIIREIDRGEDNEKTIIFSQFTSLLDLLEVPIAREGHEYRRYDGSMKPVDRNQAVLDFTDKPDCKVMLVSLKAGNSGLNLVAASHVIIFDPFWNPYIEEQAIDRAHRIGQLREVKVHRILIPETVEDRIIELQDKKRQLIDGALDEKAAKNVARLSSRELGYLFGIKD